MKIGVSFVATDQSESVAHVARAVEARGFESLWCPEHSHMPVSQTKFLTGTPLTEPYRRMLDPFVGLATAAAVTERIHVGTGVCLVAQRDPIQLAKETATLDFVSNGRFELGIGFGWNAPEMHNHGIDPEAKQRRALVREKILLVKELWTKEVAEFDGELVQLTPSRAWPKPAQTPHVPVHLGGQAGPTTFAHVVEYCDAWMPSHSRGNVVPAVAELHATAEAAGRDPATIALEVFSVPPDPTVLEEYATNGFSRAVLRLEQTEPGEVDRLLDEYAKVASIFAEA